VSDKAVFETESFLRGNADIAISRFIYVTLMPMSGQGSGGEGQSGTQLSADQDIPQSRDVNREAEGLHEPYALETPPFVMVLISLFI
jgi:hypothetical protein